MYTPFHTILCFILYINSYGFFINLDKGITGLVYKFYAFKNGVTKALDETDKAEGRGSQSLTGEPGAAGDMAKKWLSIYNFDLSTGLVGIGYDLLTNYIGRAKYHNHNGPLLDRLHDLQHFIVRDEPAADLEHKNRRIKPDEKRIKKVKEMVALLREIPPSGMNLFEEGGAVYELLQDFNNLVEDDERAQTLALNLMYQSESIKGIVTLLDDEDYVWKEDSGEKGNNEFLKMEQVHQLQDAYEKAARDDPEYSQHDL